MAFNKIMLGDIPIIDLTNDSVTEDKLLAGITAHARNGEIITGSMTNQGAVSGVINSLAGYNIPAGYHDGSGTVSINSTEQAKIIPENIKSGVSILGVQGNLAVPILTPVAPNATNVTHFWLPKTVTRAYCSITYEDKTNTRSDEYAVEAGKLYLARFLEPYGARCGAAFSEVSLVGRTSSVAGCPVLAPVYRHKDIYFVAPMNGYLIMYKDDTRNDGFLTECFEVQI